MAPWTRWDRMEEDILVIGDLGTLEKAQALLGTQVPFTRVEDVGRGTWGRGCPSFVLAVARL